MDFLYCSYCGGHLRESTEYGTVHRICTRCERRYYNNPVPAVGVLLMNMNRQIMLALREYPPHPDTWDVPGGFLDVDETAEEALRRELKEELSLVPEQLLYVGSSHDRYEFGKRNYHMINLLFAGTIGESSPIASDDISGVSWFEPDTIPYEKILFPNLSKLIRAVVDKRLYSPLFS